MINYTKQTNFSNYFNNLRIDYSINKMKSDRQFRLFTIQAIAESSGFNKAQTFSPAFYKKTGLYPSYFIKQLKKV